MPLSARAHDHRGAALTPAAPASRYPAETIVAADARRSAGSRRACSYPPDRISPRRRPTVAGRRRTRWDAPAPPDGPPRAADPRPGRWSVPQSPGVHWAAPAAAADRVSSTSRPRSAETPTDPAPGRPRRAPSHRVPDWPSPTRHTSSLASRGAKWLTPRCRGPRRFLIVRPSVGHVPNAGPGPRRVEGGSTKTGRRIGSATRPSPDTTEKPRPGIRPSRTLDTSPMRQRRASRFVLPAAILLL